MHQAGWDDQVSVPASDAPEDATQNLLAAVVHCCAVQPDVHPDPQALFHKAVSVTHSSEPALGSVGMSSQVQHLALVLVMNFSSIYMFYLPSLVPLLYSSKTERALQFCICV